jgi:2Fe-2S ferredoxin
MPGRALNGGAFLARVNYREPGGAVHTAEAKDGQSVMETARQAGIGGIVAICSGSMMCGTCHVVVVEAWFDRTGPAGDDEAAVLEVLDARADVQPTSRLSCQIRMSPALDGLLVRLPRYQPGV